ASPPADRPRRSLPAPRTCRGLPSPESRACGSSLRAKRGADATPPPPTPSSHEPLRAREPPVPSTLRRPRGGIGRNLRRSSSRLAKGVSFGGSFSAPRWSRASRRAEGSLLGRSPCDRRFDEAAEERMCGGRLALEFGVILHRQEPRMLVHLDDL